MIYRTVLAVLLATALLAVTLPPLDDARRERGATAVATDLEAVERAANDLVATDNPTTDAGARRVVTVRLPASRWTSAGVDRITITPSTADAPARVSWQVHRGRTATRRLPGLRLETATGGPLRLRETGRHRLVLVLSGTPESPVVTVRRLK